MGAMAAEFLFRHIRRSREQAGARAAGAAGRPTFLTSGSSRGRNGAASAGLSTSLLMLLMMMLALRLTTLFRSRSALTCAARPTLFLSAC